MSIILDPVATHGPGTGNGTVPPGITPNEDGSWTGSHIVSTDSLTELQAFLTGIGFDVANIRTPQDSSPSLVTYAGLSSAQRDAAITAGATEFNRRHVIANVFDRGDTSLYEPE